MLILLKKLKKNCNVTLILVIICILRKRYIKHCPIFYFILEKNKYLLNH